VTVDRLNPSFLGPYGGTFAATPNFNRLAATSLLLEFAVSDAPDLERVLRSYWQGVHACLPGGRCTSPSNMQLLETAGVATTLVTDDAAVIAHPLAMSFRQQVQLPLATATVCASDEESTQIVQSLAAALEILAEQQAPFHLHIHLKGLGGAWDAPLELRERLRGDDDPEPRRDATTPSLRLEDDYDPDLLVGITQAYAAQTMLVDMALGALLAAIETHAARDELLLVVTAPRGFPLGEHRVVGDFESQLYGELLHVPLFIRRADGAGAMTRDAALAQPADIAATLADWHSIPCDPPSRQAASLLARGAPTPTPWPREQTLSIVGDERATRTAAWFLRQSSAAPGEPQRAGETHRLELFSKPDDRFEANEIASRCPDIAAALAQQMLVLEKALIANDFSQIPPLPPELVGGDEL
jgi:arylsulfatase A-like enzyme